MGFDPPVHLGSQEPQTERGNAKLKKMGGKKLCPGLTILPSDVPSQQQQQLRGLLLLLLLLQHCSVFKLRLNRSSSTPFVKSQKRIKVFRKVVLKHDEIDFCVFPVVSPVQVRAKKRTLNCCFDLERSEPRNAVSVFSLLTYRQARTRPRLLPLQLPRPRVLDVLKRSSQSAAAGS